MQERVTARLPALVASQDSFSTMAWVQLLRKSHPGAFNTLGQLQGLLLPALDETSVMEQASTPVQKVRLWAEAMVEAIALISALLQPEGLQPMEAQESVLGGPDIPDIVFFLSCCSSCPALVLHVKLAQLFCLDNYGVDAQNYQVPSWARVQDVAGQYAHLAEERCIDHSHYLLWAEDTLQLIAGAAPAKEAICNGKVPSPQIAAGGKSMLLDPVQPAHMVSLDAPWQVPAPGNAHRRKSFGGLARSVTASPSSQGLEAALEQDLDRMRSIGPLKRSKSFDEAPNVPTQAVYVELSTHSIVRKFHA